MALKFHCFPPSSPPLIYTHYSELYCRISFPQHFGIGRLHKLSSLSATSTPNPNPNTSTSLSSPSIFLPFLQEEEEEEDDPNEDLDSIEDPILKFFKSRSSAPDPDPSREGKLSLQKNRRTSWHLAPDLNVDVTENLQLEPKIELTPQKQHLVYAVVDGVVSQILELAKNLPENLTLGEVLGPYEGKLGDRECVEVLGLMGEEKGLLLSCLYFFEWMGLQEPSLITARACSVLFPVLGRGGMGDNLMVLFRNLPTEKQFRDVHVFNAAISGLLFCERYEFFSSRL